MLKFGEFLHDIKSYDKYRNYKIQDIKNDTLSYVVGAMFSRFAINPQMYLRIYLDEYKYYVYGALGMPLLTLMGY